ncbi:MAG TPA: PQQ-binding-like beta-propeller repeat protein, partial [Pyrinomonadaceae bacterium]|nr:PQQ-binding-like beta-propeller repeat protein [Pyrinomonadaceae bacterium]
SQDGRWLASRRLKNGDVDVWDVTSGRLARTFAGDNPYSYSLALSPDGKVLAAAQKGSVKLWETSTGREIRAVSADASDVAFSPDGRLLAVGTRDGVQLWDASTYQPSRGSALDMKDAGTGFPRSTVIAFSPDGRLLAAGSGSTVRIWEVGSGREVRTIRRVEPKPLPGHIVTIGGISSLSFSPDGRQVAAGGASREVRAWDVSTGRELREYHVNAIDANVVGFSGDGRTLVTREVFLGKGIETYITVWDVTSGSKAERLPFRQVASHAAALAPSTNRLAVVTERGLQVWDIQKGALVTTLAVK